MLKLKTFNYLMIALKLICGAVCVTWAYKARDRSSTFVKIFGLSCSMTFITLVSRLNSAQPDN